MGCNCKNKTTESKIKTLKKEKEIIIPTQTEPPYTREEIIRVKNYLSSKMKTETERQFMIEFNKTYFGENIIGYCDQPCMERVRKRLDHATMRINEWEQLNKK